LTHPNFSVEVILGLSKKREYDNLINKWKITFQVSNNKGCNFLELLDNENNLLKLTYSKDGTWLKYFVYSNLLYARATRAIINYVPIDKYWLRFFSHEDFKCLCKTYPIKTRHHILYECKRYNNYWNPRKDTIGHLTPFLVYKSNDFSFGKVLHNL